MLKMPAVQIFHSGEVVATDVPYESFLTDFDGQSVEWIDGVVIKISPVSVRHDAMTAFLRLFFSVYLELTGGGQVMQGPMVRRVRSDLPARAPDIQVILPHNLDIIRDNEVAGAADLVVEVVSPDSHRRDRVEKFAEYERGGVKEYWILDLPRQESLFYALGDDGIYHPRDPDDSGIYHSAVLSHLHLPISLFWRETLPSVIETVEIVPAMLAETGE